MYRRTFVGAGGVALIGSLAGCLARGSEVGGETTEVVERTFSAPDVREVAVKNGVGDVTVAAQGTGGTEVRVLKRSARGQSGLDDLRVRIGLDDGVLGVETSHDRRSLASTRETPRADVRITVPEIGTGPVVTSVETELGDVTLLGILGDTSVYTKLGDVVASGADGYLALSSDLGAILASDVTGIDSVHTDLGSVTVDVLGLHADAEIGTNLGEATVGVADDLDLDFLVEANGGFDSNLPATDSRTDGSRHTGRLNRGGHRLRAYSDLGDVFLRSISGRESDR